MRPTLAMSTKWTTLPLLAVFLSGPAVAKQKKPKHAESGPASATEAAPASMSPAENHDSPPGSAVEAPRAQAPGGQAAQSTTVAANLPAPDANAPADGAGAGGGSVAAKMADGDSAANGNPAPAGMTKEEAPEPDPVAPGKAIEELPGAAFQRPRVAGLVGGSLWLEPTAWATQWPYVPRTGIGISGSAWVDTGYEQIKNQNNTPTHADTVYQLQQGRAVLRVTPGYSDGHFFVQGQAELVANKDQSVSQQSNQVVDTDDLWVRVGYWKMWDLQLGRYQGWEIYHLGMGLDLNTLERHGATDSQFSDPVDFYGVTYGYQRSSGVGNVGLHVFPTDFVRFEILGHYGFENGLNTLGGRPVGVLDILGGHIRIKAGGEYRRGRSLQTGSDQATGAKIDGQEKLVQRGYGGSIQVILPPWVEFGINAAAAIVDHTTNTGSPDATGSFNVKSAGGFLNLGLGELAHQAALKDLLLGVGADYTVKDDLQKPTATHLTNTQAFAALQYRVGGQLYLKAVAAYDKGTWLHVQNDASLDPIVNKMLSIRVRAMYLF